MKEQQQHCPSYQNPGSAVIRHPFSRSYTNPILFVALLILSYIFLLTVSYNLGFSRGSSFSTRDISTFFISKTVLNNQLAPAAQCADPVPPELVRQTVINLVYNGTSPYAGFIPVPSVSLSSNQKRIKGWNSYRTMYKSLIRRVQPKTIITFNAFLGESATYMANLTSQLGLDTQILCLDDYHDLFEDKAMPNSKVTLLLHQFMQNVVSQNAKESILPVPLSTTMGIEKLCEWGIFGDLIEVDAGRDFHSAWSDINRAYKLLKPGGVLFGHNYLTSYHNKGVRKAVRLFARVNKFRVKEDGQHWMIDSA